MGSRANYVVVDETGWELYYSHGGAVPLLDVFAEGPEAVLEVVRADEPVEQFLNDVWCEGAALIDTVDRVLMLFTWHHEGVDDRARRLAAIRTAWPGWQLRWAYGGIGDVVAHLGLDRSSVRAADHDDVELVPGSAFYPQDDNCLVTVRHADGSVLGYRLQEAHCAPVWAGAGLPASLAAFPSVRHWERLPEDADGPELGLHLDLGSRTLGFWTAGNFTGTVAEIAERWPGWTVEFWEDRHEEQALRCGEFRTFPFEETR
ncbi:hypothetical protein [Lentzea sp. NBRC 102530]|uniref:hypothetical protein n=1 Tax=Lentzea sp. NBRC 102530 TaxID=3032201 RepID=UPI0024A1506D|nr:hypothetical protein [Lentzea sp. NBRC 102530]GLY52627.1 hypothetical protein Lesp01_62830 [Lentzea sp. NBRC 102530]